MIKKILIIGSILTLILFIILGELGYLSFSVGQLIEKSPYSKGKVVITLNTPATDLSEYSLDLNNLTRTANLYEGLVRFDRNLRIQGALARSWGNLNRTLWEFKLRQGVTFHDGSPFKAEDVLFSFERIQKEKPAQLSSILQTIKSVKATDEYTIEIETFEPDPLILSKLTKFFITKSGQVGTGPYKILKWDKGSTLLLNGYTDYWGNLPEYKEVEYKVIRDPRLREEAFSNKKIDILASVSKDQAIELDSETLINRFSLEVSFLMFNLKHPLFTKIENRKAIRNSIDPQVIQSIGNNLVRPASQFIAPGVFGFNSSLKPLEFEEGQQAINLFGERRERVQLNYLSSYRTLVEYLKIQLDQAGFLTTLREIKPDVLLKEIEENNLPLFIIGWQSENGDAGDFLDNFIHSEGQFNKGRYSNSGVDELIERSRVELDPEKRILLLKKVMEIIDKEVIGVPLFEPSRAYGVQTHINWKPRLDGLILGKEIR